MSGNDTTAGSTPAITDNVGSLSWNDLINFGNPIGTGLTHTSNWLALPLTEAANLSITLAANGPATSGNAAGTSLVPAFSLYSGHQQTDNGGNFGWRVYNNAGNFDWSTADPAYDSSSLNYIGNAAASGTDSSITGIFSLEAGQYSIVFGGNPPFELGQTGQHAFIATLNVAPVPVPAALWLFGSKLAAMAGLARRQMPA